MKNTPHVIWPLAKMIEVGKWYKMYRTNYGPKRSLKLAKMAARV